MKMKPRFDARGELSFWFVLPSKSLRDLVEKTLLEEFPALNYGVGWKDVGGFGLSMTSVDWKPRNKKHYYRQ